MATKFPSPKDPNAVADYELNWALRLLDDTISVSTWTVKDDANITIDHDEFSNTTTTVWLSGGTAGQTYTLTNHIVTAGGREWDYTVSLSVKEL